MTFTDHLTVPDGCSEVDSSKAALTVADQARRLNALGDLRDVLEHLGLVAPQELVFEPPAEEPEPAAPPVLGEGERLCGCPGRKHVLTVGPSETTYVKPNGKRQCKFARRRTQNARNERVRKASGREAA